MTAAWRSIRTSWILFWRFWTRAFLDDEGNPTIWSFLAVYAVWWYTGYLESSPAFERAWLATALVALILIIAAATRLGAAVVVPIADSLMQALGKAVGFGATAVESIKARLSATRFTQYEPPDRTVPLAEAELARPEGPPGSQKVPDA